MRNLFLAICTALLLVHCALPQASKLKPSDFAGEIQKNRTSAKNAPDQAGRATAHYRLAMLYSHHSNPSPDYPLALKELETFIALAPEGGTDEVRDRLALLRGLERSSDENRRLLRENREIKSSVEQLTRENRELKEALEKMREFDIMIEEKRKKLR